jgi:DNA-binding CsgD family transcriptional regulator
MNPGLDSNGGPHAVLTDRANTYSPPGIKGMETVHSLWDELAKIPAWEMDAALRRLMEALARQVNADDVLWLGVIRMLHSAVAKTDPFLGWRLRARRTLLPDTARYRKLIASYLSNEHYGKLTASYYQPRDTQHLEPHIGMASRALVEGAGKFRAHRMRDGWIDFATFRKTTHYQLYYREMGIADRMWVAFPLDDGAESVFLLDRHQSECGSPNRFIKREADLAATALRGIPEFHRRLFLYNGLQTGGKPFSPMERQIVCGLLTGKTEKEIAETTGQKPQTLHKYVTALYTRFGVRSRAGLMALWLDGR